MEIPRHWRLKKQRYNLEGFRIVRKDGTIEYEFPPKNPNKLEELPVLFSPNNQIVHGVVIRQDQKQDNSS